MAKHSGCCGCAGPTMARRSFMAAVGGSAAGVALMRPFEAGAAGLAGGTRPTPTVIKKPLIVQPVLVYRLYEKREATSWRPWGGLHSEADVQAESARITRELAQMTEDTEFPLLLRDVAPAVSREQAAALRDGDADVMLIYAASGDGAVIETLLTPDRYNLMFVRHKSGPVYLWYEIASPRMLRKTVDVLGQPGLLPEDVVVDDHANVLWRLRSFYALKNTVGAPVLCIGGASGWGHGGQNAPEIARNLWKMDLIDLPYDELGKLIEAARADAALVERTAKEAAAYLADPQVTLATDKSFVERAFLLTEVVRQCMAEAGTSTMTINHCMGTVMPISQTTACLTLTLLNDEGCLAFCESDFVVIPSGMLLHHIASVPVFLQDPTYPHDGVVTIAHCTAPRRMNGRDLEPAAIMTHFESDYGAAPKVAMTLGQKVTVIDPDFEDTLWIGFTGNILDNPFLDICRSQIDISIDGDCARLAREMRGFHWMLAYGDHLKETGYALSKLGIGWYNLTADKHIAA
jgi:hypothetical protein